MPAERDSRIALNGRVSGEDAERAGPDVRDLLEGGAPVWRAEAHDVTDEVVPGLA